MTIKSLLLNDSLLGRRKERGVPSMGVLGATDSEWAQRMLDISQAVEKSSSHRIEIFPVAPRDEQGSYEIGFRDYFPSIGSNLAGIAAACATSYKLAEKVTHAEELGAKKQGEGMDMHIRDVIVLSAGGWLADSLTHTLLDSILGVGMKQAIGIAKISSVPSTSPPELASSAILKQIEEAPSYKESGISTSKNMSIAFNLTNAALLGYHGYKRHEGLAEEGRSQLMLGGIAATWAVAGLLGFTNLGVAAAQGFAQPLARNVGDPKLVTQLKPQEMMSLSHEKE